MKILNAIKRSLSHFYTSDYLCTFALCECNTFTKFYKVTNLDRTRIEEGLVLTEDIVNDILYQHHENPFSSWARLTPQHVKKIYTLLKDAVPQETHSDNAMLTYVKAAIRQDIDIGTLSNMVQS